MTEKTKINALKRLRFDDLTKIKKGDVLYESEYYDILKLVVCEDSAVSVETFTVNGKQEDFQQVFWKAIVEYNGEETETEFLATKGLEHYGPKIYRLEEIEVPVNMAHLDMRIEV